MNTLKRILVVDDNPVTTEVLRFNLQRAGFEVAVAGNGQQALELTSCEDFALVITDYQMPVLNGEQFCRRLRKSETNQSVPIILLSAKGLEIDSQRLKTDCRLSQILFKPFSPREVVEMARQAVAEMAGA